MVSCCWFAVSLEPVVDGQKNVTRNQFCVYVGLWRNCLSSGQLLWLREIDSEDAVTTGYPGVPKIILIIGLQTDSDGKWTISFHEAHKCAVIIAAPSLAHSFCRKENPTSEISSIDWKHSLWERATKVTLNKIHLEAVSHPLNSSNGLVQMVFLFSFVVKNKAEIVTSYSPEWKLETNAGPGSQLLLGWPVAVNYSDHRKDGVCQVAP